LFYTVVWLYNQGAVDTLYTARFGEVSGLNSFKDFQNQTTGCGDITYCLVGYFIMSHPVETSLYRTVLIYIQMIISSCHNARV